MLVIQATKFDFPMVGFWVLTGCRLRGSGLRTLRNDSLQAKLFGGWGSGFRGLFRDQVLGFGLGCGV